MQFARCFVLHLLVFTVIILRPSLEQDGLTTVYVNGSNFLIDIKRYCDFLMYLNNNIICLLYTYSESGLEELMY